MATHRRHTTEYDSYSSTDYATMYDGSAVRAPRREEELQTPPRPRQREHVRRQNLTRTQVQVRQAGQVAPLAVIGFLSVAVLAALLLFSYTQSTVLNAEVVSLRGELATLEKEHATLSAQYERVFDMEKVEQAVGKTMIRPTQDQVVYIDLSEPDTVVVYGGDTQGGFMSMLKSMAKALSEWVEYFR